VPRFNPEDFYEGERLHERYRWPVDYKDLVPYYEQVERLMSITGGTQVVPLLPAQELTYRRRLADPWQQISNYAKGIGRGLAPSPLANGPDWMISRSSTAFNSFTRIVPRLKKYPNFKMIMGAHVTRLEWNGKQKKVDALTYIDRATGSEQRLTASAVVVACGPLHSTKLLLNSTSSDFPDGLGNTEGVLGHYLHDHPSQWFVVEVDKPLPRLPHPIYLTRAAYDKSPPLLAASCTFGSAGGTAWKKVLASTPLPTREFGVNCFGTMIPVLDNYVRLDPSVKDEFGNPSLNIHFRYDEATLGFLETTRNQVTEILGAAGYQAEVKRYYVKNPGNSVHYGGTIRMHNSPKYGMLNGWNRLHAVDNVAVVDASSFTTGCEKNPTLTAMALAARAADGLANWLKTS
jgi:choline dehydrogenase-like flavoprotein